MSPAKIASSYEEYQQARSALLRKEKAIVKARDEVAQLIHELPLVEMKKHYKLTARDSSGNDKTVSLSDLFEGRRQLLVHHFMFHPDAEEGCTWCSLTADHIPPIQHLHSHNTSFVQISGAPIEQLEKFKARMGWTFPWVSCYKSDFGNDFHVSKDLDGNPLQNNFFNGDEVVDSGTTKYKGEWSGFSTFIMGNGKDVGEHGKVYHIYTAFDRGVEPACNTFAFHDWTHLGRQDELYRQKAEVTGYKKHDSYTREDLYLGE